MIKTVIIDDVLSFREEIRENLNIFFKNEIIVVGEAESIEQGIKLIDTLLPNLVLLDIELKDGSSFDLLEQISFNNFQLIFITGFNEHAIKAIKLGALDYILKPIDVDEFNTSIKKVINNTIKTLDLLPQVNVSNDYFKGVKNKRVVLKTMETHYIVYIDDIIYCHSDGNYTTFHLNNNKKILISKPMKKVENLIACNSFLKCHQSYLVNTNYIEQYLTEGYLYLTNDIKIPIASRRKEFILQKLNNI